MNKDQKIICSNIWKLFGPDEKRIIKNLDPNLSIKEVQEKTGHVVAVKNVSFSIQKGETFVVMGLSGSGKSTLVRCISRLIEPTSGTVKMDDVDVTKFPAPIWHENDGGRYIGTGTYSITRDPEDGWLNAGAYRSQVYDKNTVGFFLMAV